MPKIFFNDLGMRNILLNRLFDFHFRDDRGQLLENFVFNRLTEIHDEDGIRFWRTQDKKEIDFVVTTSFAKGKAFEVKMTCEKKTKSANTFMEYYPAYEFEMLS